MTFQEMNMVFLVAFWVVIIAGYAIALYWWYFKRDEIKQAGVVP